MTVRSAEALAATRVQNDSRPVLALLAVHAGRGFATDDVETVESLLLNALEATGRFHRKLPAHWIGVHRHIKHR